MRQPGLFFSCLAVGLCGAALACSGPAQSQELRAFGTEPFWSVEVGSEQVVLLDMATGDTVTYAAVDAITAAGRTADYARAYLLDADPAALLIVRRAEPPGCSDGMSDNRYPYLAFFFRGNRLYEGCARHTD